MRPEPETLLQWYKPSHPTSEELESVELIKPGDYEIFNEKLNNFLLEDREVLIRMGISSMLVSGDIIVGIYTSQGDMATCSAGTYLHVVTAQLPIKFIVNNWLGNPTVGVKDGDIFYVNDARYGGIHNPDQLAIMPVFNDGELIAWTVACVHQPETGGTIPGGVVENAKTICEEGMRLTPIKIGENFRLRDDLLLMMENMVVRAPRMQDTDIRARATACDRLRRRIVELARQKGNRFIKGLLLTLIIRSEEASRRRIANWNDGIYRAALLLDTEGEDTSLLRVFCSLHKEGDHITFDFTGTSPEHDGGGRHGLPHQTMAAIAIYLFAFAFHDLPVSSGTLAPFDVIVPRGTFYNPHPMASTSGAPPAMYPAISAAYILFAKMMFDSPERHLITAPTVGSAMTIFSGLNQWGVPISDIAAYALNTEGGGARHDMDGVDAYGFAFCHIGRSPDAEFNENEFPLLHLYQKFLKDSCGPGKYRGGSGTTTAYVVHNVPWISVYGGAANFQTTSNQGLFGGYPHSARPGIQVNNTDVWEKMARGDKDIPSDTIELITKRSIKGNYVVEAKQRITRVLMNGDIFVDASSGGAGYGDVLERAPEMVTADLRKEIISHWAARNVYHIAYNPTTLEVDYKKTEELRRSEIENRKARGKKYEDFVKEWSQKRPPEEALKHYGSWPDAKKVRDIIRI